MRDERISELLAFARSLGIGDAKLLGVDRITVEDRFRSQCAEPRCPNYDTSINCPPHSMTPGQFREHIKGFTLVLAFKFDMPMEAVQGTERGRLHCYCTRQQRPSSTRLNRWDSRAPAATRREPARKHSVTNTLIAQRFRMAASVATRTRRGPHSPAWASIGTNYQNPLDGRCRRTKTGT